MGVALYKRGDTWWYKFQFKGMSIRESARTGNKSVAAARERERHSKLEDGSAGRKRPGQPPLFSVAVKKWLEIKRPHWSANSYRIECKNVEHLSGHFDRMLLSDVSADDISRYQAVRQKSGASPKTINLEIGTLRALMRKHKLWANLQDDVTMLRVKEEVGRALSADEQHRLLIACKNSRSRSLYVAVLLALHSGLRNQELRLLRWRQVDLLEPVLTVGKSKTSGGEGRTIPLSKTVLAGLQEWRRQFPEAEPSDYVFPSERYGLEGQEGHQSGKAIPYSVRPDVPIGSWKTAWRAARKASGVSCRWHDCRHTFVSRMAEAQASDTTITALAGWMSKKMMERYSHTRNEAKRQAIAALDLPASDHRISSKLSKESGHKTGHTRPLLDAACKSKLLK
jgi:integrase